MDFFKAPDAYFWLATAAFVPAQHSEIMDTSHVYNEAVFIIARTLEELLSNVHQCTELFQDVAAIHGLECAYGPGKSEVLIPWQGKDAQVTRQRVNDKQ